MAKIIGLGEWFPSTIRTNDAWNPELITTFKKHLERDLLDVISSDSKMDPISEANFAKEMPDPFVGTVERRIVEPNDRSYDAEIAAAKMAIEESGIDPAQIGAGYSYSFFSDMPHLTCGAHILKQLGAENAFGCGLDGACSSALIQLMTAKALVDSGQIKYVLITQSNFFTKGLPLEHPASPSVGDAATAILVGPDSHEGHRILNVHARSHGEHYRSVGWRRKDDEGNWAAPGGAHYLGSFNSAGARELVQTTVQMGVKTINSCLSEINLLPSDLNFFISMSPRKWIPSAIAHYLGLQPSQTIETFEKYAHLGPCGALVNLLEARRQNLIHKGDKVGIYSQGAGFTRAAAIVEW